MVNARNTGMQFLTKLSAGEPQGCGECRYGLEYLAIDIGSRYAIPTLSRYATYYKNHYYGQTLGILNSPNAKKPPYSGGFSTSFCSLFKSENKKSVW